MKTLILLFLFHVSSSFAQDFSKRFEHNIEPIWAKAVSSNDQYQTLVAGKFGYNEMGFLLKFNELGDIDWQKTIDWSADSLVNTQFFEITPTPDSAYLITAGGQRLAQIQDHLCIVIKLDLSGNILWQKQFESPDSQCFYAASTIQNDSSYWIAWGGVTEGQGNNLINLNEGGNLLSAFRYNYNTPSNVSSINVMDDSTLYLAGRLDISGEPEAFLTKIKTNGSIQWTQTYDSLRFEDAVIQDSSLFLAAYNEHSEYSEFIKMDSTGNIQFRYGLSASFKHIEDNKAQIIQLMDSTLIMCFQREEWYPYSFQFDTDGNYLNSFDMEGKNGLIMSNQNGGATFLANGPLFGVKKNMWDEHFAVVRFDSALYTTNCFNLTTVVPDTFNVLPSNLLSTNIAGAPLELPGPHNTPLDNLDITHTIGCALFIGDVEEIEFFQFVSIYPNISDGHFEFDFSTSEPVQLQIFSPLGQLVSSNTNIQKNITIDLSEFENGAYFYVAILRDGRTNNGKLILQK